MAELRSLKRVGVMVIMFGGLNIVGEVRLEVVTALRPLVEEVVDRW